MYKRYNWAIRIKVENHSCLMLKTPTKMRFGDYTSKSPPSCRSDAMTNCRRTFRRNFAEDRTFLCRPYLPSYCCRRRCRSGRGRGREHPPRPSWCGRCCCCCCSCLRSPYPGVWPGWNSFWCWSIINNNILTNYIMSSQNPWPLASSVRNELRTNIWGFLLS